MYVPCMFAYTSVAAWVAAVGSRTCEPNVCCAEFKFEFMDTEKRIFDGA